VKPHAAHTIRPNSKLLQMLERSNAAPCRSRSDLGLALVLIDTFLFHRDMRVIEYAKQAGKLPR